MAASRAKVLLKTVKSISVRFCPFESNVRSTREFLYAISSQRARSSNINCKVTADVRHDKSEPLIDIMFGNDVLTRKMGCATKPDLMISKDGDRFTVKVKSTFLNSEMDFLLGEEFEEHTADSRKTWTVVTFNDGVLSQVQKWNGKESTIKKELENGQLKETSVIGDVTCIRIYEKL
ncbi:putative fatty acid-binding protein 5-like protein 3 isoform X2 [Rhinatrema bivittatum]|uniref:putative fatty acid-binding protein 5-like protein 3 isoform X2 n=1 Tax=Rhinatrema bivittatum TaxID=194408 RepID=UPI00112E77A6|nr:putative fatty acid-binding protein 5-like protein 3 isoform X2 [Rhinatrema bivittatum]